MFFNAKVNKTPYQVTVNEDRHNWIIKFKTEKAEKWKEVFLKKSDYQVNEDGLVSLLYQNSSYLLDIAPQGLDYMVYTRGSHRKVSIMDDERILRDSLMGGRGLGGQENLKAGMPGKIVKTFVKAGDEIKAGEPLLIMEAMKMENEMKASSDVTIDRVHIKEGQNVESGALLISFKSK